MSTVYRIREWDDRYEVNTGNSAWKPGQEKRRGPLSYIRMPVNGRSLTRPMMRLNALAGKNAPAVFGVFTKLMELAADNDPALRGQLIDSDGTPLAAKDIAEILCWPVSTIESALKVLSHKDLRWIEQTPVLGIPRDSEEVQGKPISDQNTDQNTETETETETETGAGKPATPSSPSLSIPDFVSAWDSIAEGEDVRIKKIASMTKDRKEAFGARVKEPFFVENWRKGLEKIAASRFCNGLNNRNWIADVDFFLRPSSLPKIMEGKYDNKEGVHTGGFDIGF